MPENEEKPETLPPTLTRYQLISMVRSRHNRSARMALPVAPRRKQYIGDSMLRLAHGRPLIITEEVLRKNLAEVKEKAAGHVLEVRTMDGKLVDLDTLQPIVGTEAVEGDTRPQFQLDSIANDKNFPGLDMPPSYPNDDLTPPQVLEAGQKPALFEDAEQVAREADEPDAPTGEIPAADGGTAPEPKDEVSSDKTATKSSGKKKGR